MRTAGNFGGAIGYEPNSKGTWKEKPEFAEPPLSLEGSPDHWNHRVDDGYYTQPGDLFRLMTPEKQRILFENTPRSVGGASLEIQKRRVENCYNADPAYGEGVARALSHGVSAKTRIPVIQGALGRGAAISSPCAPRT